MNLNILNNRHLYLLRVVLLNGFLFAQENLISWEVGDPTLNRKFIETYLNKIIANDKFDDNSIQASDVIMLQMENTEKGLVLKRLRAKNYDSGEFRRFMMDQVKLMDPKLMDELIKRKYKWGEVSKRELSELESYSTVDNILQERSFKRARDAFWWSTSQLEIATTGSAFIRGRSSSQAFRMEMGLQDLGLHRQIFKNLLLGISNDISSAYVLIPSGSRSVSSVGGKTVPDGHALSGTYGVGFKFDTHSIGGQVNYMDASNRGDKDSVNTALNAIKRHVINDAKDIKEKYTQTGITIDLGVMFIPSESLMQLIDSIEDLRLSIFRDSRVLVMGPNSLAAYLISIHMGFRNLALNERAEEILVEFGNLKKEFESFESSTEDLSKKAEAMLKAVDKHETRERQMNRALKRMEEIGEDNKDNE